MVTDVELHGAGSLLRKFVGMLCKHVADIVPLGASLAAKSSHHFSLVSKILSSDVTGKIYIKLVILGCCSKICFKSVKQIQIKSKY